jgi:hypothetical protein
VPQPDNPEGTYQPCGYRLDDTTHVPTAPAITGEEPLHLQHRLLALLRCDQPPAVASVGQPTSPARYFADLRIMTTLLAASWPAATTRWHPAMSTRSMRTTGSYGTRSPPPEMPAATSSRSASTTGRRRRLPHHR